MLSKECDVDLIDNCYFWSGVCYFQKGLLGKAIASFVKVLEIPFSEKHEAALFMIGQCYERAGNYKGAQETFNMVLKQYPETCLKSVIKQKIFASK